jgi:hypothetical protein
VFGLPHGSSMRNGSADSWLLVLLRGVQGFRLRRVRGRRGRACRPRQYGRCVLRKIPPRDRVCIHPVRGLGAVSLSAFAHFGWCCALPAESELFGRTLRVSIAKPERPKLGANKPGTANGHDCMMRASGCLLELCAYLVLHVAAGCDCSLGPGGRAVGSRCAGRRGGRRHREWW